MIKNFIKKHNICAYYDVSIKKYNTYALDVICDYLVFPKDYVELKIILEYVKSNGYKFLVLGNGSNVIFSKKHYDGVIIKLDKMKKMIVMDDVIEVGGGYSVIKLAMETALMGLSGFEFASGIPGSIASSVAMNAGAYNHSLSEILISVKVIDPDFNVVEIKASDLDFEYRDSFLKKHKDYIVVSAKFQLKYGDSKEILDVISKRRIRRIASQPINYPQAGSVFRNPEGMYAGELIEKCGLKGYSIGGAMISEKHANFIVNYNNACGEDIINLINLAQDRVYQEFGVKLKLEQIIID